VKRRAFLSGAAAAAAWPVLAQTPPDAAPPAPAPAVLAPVGAGLVRVKVQTGQGLIVLDLEAEKASLTTANFLRYVDQKRYDHSTIYRALHAPGAPEYGLIQGGLRNDPAKLLKPVAHESTLKTGLSHKDGTISLARRAQGTATSDFFICIGEASYLDADPKAQGDNAGFAAFGQVVQGMDVVHKILALPTDPDAGGPEMKGEMLKPPVPVSTMRRAT
jgi:peptidyl-prolyl cis-trans isomerase A (cyclophilin A)